MIRLLVEDYCHRGCKAFEADVERPDTYHLNRGPGDEIEFATDTNVRCAKRNLCKQLMLYLTRYQADADRGENDHAD